MRHIAKDRLYRGDQIDGEAFALRKDKDEKGLSVTRLPRSQDTWSKFLQRYWFSVPLPSGDLPGLALISDEALEKTSLGLRHEPIEGNQEHFEVIGVTEADAEQLALIATQHGIVAPFLKKPKEPGESLRSDYYIWPIIFGAV